MSRPRKIKVSIKFLSVDDSAPSAEEICGHLSAALNLRGLSYDIQVDELTCNCGSDAWPSYCPYHDKRYGG